MEKQQRGKEGGASALRGVLRIGVVSINDLRAALERSKEASITIEFAGKDITFTRHTNPDGSSVGWKAKADTESVDPTATLGRGTIVMPDATIGPYATIGPDATIDEGATIGPGAIIRDGATIGPGAKIGDLASIGRGATIGRGDKFGARVHIAQGDTVPDGSRVT